MSLAEYLKWWQQHKAGLDDRLLYLKDWHFVNEFPGYQVCTTTQIPAIWPKSSVPHLLKLFAHAFQTEQGTERQEYCAGLHHSALLPG